MLAIEAANSPDFDARMRHLLPAESVAAIEDITDYFVILTNRSKRPLVAYTVKFSLEHSDGTAHVIYTRFWEPLYALLGGASVTLSSDVLLPGMVKITSMGLTLHSVDFSELDVIAAYYDQLKELNLNTVTSVSVKLDCAIDNEWFTSGEDAGKTIEQFQSCVEAARGVLRDIVKSFDGGQHLPEILDGVKTRSEELRKHRPTPPTQRYRVNAIADIRRVANRVNAIQFEEPVRIASNSASPQTRRVQ